MDLEPEAPTTFRNISLTVGEPLTIDCKSSKKITFFYPEFEKKVSIYKIDSGARLDGTFWY